MKDCNRLIYTWWPFIAHVQVVAKINEVSVSENNILAVSTPGIYIAVFCLYIITFKCSMEKTKYLVCFRY